MTDEQNIEQPVLTPIAADSYRGLAKSNGAGRLAAPRPSSQL